MVGLKRMTLAAFRQSLAQPRPPAGLPMALSALWWAGKDNWSSAHDIVMNGEGPDCAWVYAYLHRVEDDHDNARYWYRRARQTPGNGSLKAEWTAMAAALLAAQSH
jgi:hypothetical protein